MRKKRVPHVIGDVSERADARMLGDHQCRWSSEHERRLTTGLDMLLEIFEERRASLVAIHAPEIQDEVRRDA